MLFSDWLGFRRTFRGGIYLPDEKMLTARRPIEPLPLSGALHVPLQHGGHLPTRAVVRAGQPVRAGDVLAEASTADSIAVHSPVAGRVAEIGRVWTARDGWLPAATIEPDGGGASGTDSAGDGFERRAAGSLTEVAETARRCSVFDVTSRTPLHVLLGRLTPTVTTLIVNAVETEPNLTCELRTLVEQARRVIDGLAWLARTQRDAKRDVPAWRDVILAVALRHRRMVRQLRTFAAGGPVRVVALPDKYPQCHPALLTQALLGREVPLGGSPLDVGALVMPLATLRALADSVLASRPCTSRVVTVSGDAAEIPGNFVVPFGTPVRRLIEHVGLRRRAVLVLAGGPMTGIALPDDSGVVTGDVAGVTLLSRTRAADPTACIRCGWCVEDCPAGINPRELTQLELRPGLSEADRTGLSACIDCGICTYVCPVELPLARSITVSRRRVELSEATAP